MGNVILEKLNIREKFAEVVSRIEANMADIRRVDSSKQAEEDLKTVEAALTKLQEAPSARSFADFTFLLSITFPCIEKSCKDKKLPLEWYNLKNSLQDLKNEISAMLTLAPTAIPIYGDRIPSYGTFFGDGGVGERAITPPKGATAESALITKFKA